MGRLALLVRAADDWLLDHVFQRLLGWALLHEKDQIWCARATGYVTIGIATLTCIAIPRTNNWVLIGGLVTVVLIIFWTIFPIFQITNKLGKPPTEEDMEEGIKLLSETNIPEGYTGNPLRIYAEKKRTEWLVCSTVALIYVSVLIRIVPLEATSYLYVGYIWSGIGYGIYSILAFLSCGPPKPNQSTEDVETETVPQRI